MWDISSWLLQQSAAVAPYLWHGVSPLGHGSWLWMWGIFLAACCSNVPWFVDLTFQFLWNIALYSIGLSFHHQSQPQPWVFCFGSVSSFFFRVSSPLISSSILGTYWPGEFIFQCRIFFPFQTVHGVYKGKILKWFPIPFCSGYFLSELHHDPSILVALHSMAYFHCVRQGCGPCDQIGCFAVTVVSVCLPSEALSQLLLSFGVFLTLHVGYLFTAAPAKYGCCSLAWTSGISSWPQLLTFDEGYLFSAARSSNCLDSCT